MGNYPSEPTLKFIEKFDLKKRPLKELLDLLEGEWEYGDQGYFRLFKRAGNVYLQLHTAGWSGNEDLYYAFEKVKFVGVFWTKSERGGHYYYTFPKCVYENGLKKVKQ